MPAKGSLNLDCVIKDDMKEEVERQYRRRYPLMPVDRFLCQPRLALEFISIVRDSMGVGPVEWPDADILQMLVNLRKRGQIKAGEKQP